MIRDNRTFRQLLGASSVSMLGSHVTTIAYPLLVLRLTGSPFTAGCVAFAATAPGILVHIPAGALVDRWNPRRTMLVSEVGRGVAIGTVAVTIALGTAIVPLLIGMAVVEGVLEVVSGLAERRYVGSLVRRSQVPAALVRIEARTHLVLVAGRPLGGLLFEISPIFPFLADVASFIYSVVTLKRIRDSADLGSEEFTAHGEPIPKSSLMNDMRQGLRWIRDDTFACLTIISFAIGTLIFQALIMVFMADADGRRLSAFDIGLVLAASGVGGTLGSAAAPRLLAKVNFPWMRIQMFAWFAGFAILIFPIGRQFLLSAFIMAILGLTGALGNIALDTHLMQNGGKEMLARVTSVSRVATFSACAVGPLLGGVLVQEFGVHNAMFCLFLFTPVLLLLSARTPKASSPQDNPQASQEDAGLEGADLADSGLEDVGLEEASHEEQRDEVFAPAAPVLPATSWLPLGQAADARGPSGASQPWVGVRTAPEQVDWLEYERADCS
jgi:MFS family permease